MQIHILEKSKKNCKQKNIKVIKRKIHILQNEKKEL